MKKLTDRDIFDKIREVIPFKSNWFNYHANFNTIALDGTFSSDELREIARVLDEVKRASSKERKIKDVSDKGFTIEEEDDSFRVDFL